MTVNIHEKSHNLATGKDEFVTIINVDVPKKLLEDLHVDKIDSSETIKSMNAKMDFGKIKGFDPIEN